MKLILDNNVWITFLLGRKLDLLRVIITKEDVSVHVCEELIGEFVDVVNRPKIRKDISAKDIDDTMEFMQVYCCYHEITTHAVSDVRDVDDLYLLSLAETIDADYIVTGDKDLLTLGEHGGTKIIRISELKELLNLSS